MLQISSNDNDAEEKKQDASNNNHASLYNSSNYILKSNGGNNNEELNTLITDLRDQGSEYFNKLLIVLQDNGNDNDNQELLKTFCDKLKIASTNKLQTFLIFDNKDNDLFDKQLQILTTNWYNKFKSICDNNNDKYIGYPSIPSMIKDNLFLSGSICSENLFILSSLNIKMIINCTKDCKNHFEKDNIKYHRIPIDDSDDQDIKQYLEKSYLILDECMNNNKNINILVHCQQGKSRSVSIVIYYLMKKYKLTVSNALKYVQNLRSIASPNQGFMTQLQEIEKSILSGK